MDAMFECIEVRVVRISQKTINEILFQKNKISTELFDVIAADD